MSVTGPRAWPVVPLDLAGLRAAVIKPSSLWTEVRVVAETGSTNVDLLSEAGRDAPEGLVLAAEIQTAGRGRQGRAWQSLPGAALTFSVLLRPRSIPPAARGWAPLLAGVAVAEALRRTTGVAARLKWPNDVLLDGGKLAGILAEQADDAIVVGIGINVRGLADDLPVTSATSLELHGAGGTDRTELLVAALGQLETWYQRWCGTSSGAVAAASPGTGTRADAGGGLAGRGQGEPGQPWSAVVTPPGDAETSGLRAAYLRLSATLGSRVRVQLPGGRSLTGSAADLDSTGRLLVAPEDGSKPVAVSAGDVIHVR